LQLIIDKLTVERGQRRVIDSFSLSIDSGEAVVLTGPNGAGKTTLIRAIGGFLKPVEGDIRLEGGDGERDLAAQCHYVGHLNGIKSSLTVAENLEFWASYLQQDGSQQDRAVPVTQVLEIFGLTTLAPVPAGYLSAGQKRRAGLARLLLTHRPVWLLDEPTVSLDAAATALLAKLIGEHTAGGGMVIAATHLPLGLVTSRTVELRGRGEVTL
jgi:heme exporter protein A